jgi:hypothetical protein
VGRLQRRHGFDRAPERRCRAGERRRSRRAGLQVPGERRRLRLDRLAPGCAWIASRGSADATGAVAGFISTELASAGEPDTLLVRTRNSADTVFDTAGFHLQVVC